MKHCIAARYKEGEQMITTIYSAAAKLGIPHQLLRYHIRKGRVTSEQAGGVYIVNLDVARQELEQAGYFKRSAAYQERMARAAARRQAG